MLFSSLSWDISCSMCLLTGGVNSPPVGFHSYLWGGWWRKAWKPSPPTFSPWLSSIKSYLVSPFFPLFHASEHREWEYAFNECSPSHVPRALFTFTNPASLLFFFFSLSLSLVLSHSSHSLHVCMYILSALPLMGLKRSSQILCHPGCWVDLF